MTDVRMTLFDKVRLAREGSAVERCHTREHRQRYSVGHHSLDLVTLITLCWKADHSGELPRAQLLVAAAFHDVPERVTGDVPQPVKELLGERMVLADATVLDAMGVTTILTDEERPYLSGGDKLELYLWCWEQRRGGDPSYMDWVGDYDSWFDDHRSEVPASYLDLLRSVRFEVGLPRLPWPFLKSVGGL